MDENSTRFLHYYEIDTSALDLLEDAFGLQCMYHELIPSLKNISITPNAEVLSKLLLNIRKVINKY